MNAVYFQELCVDSQLKEDSNQKTFKNKRFINSFLNLKTGKYL